MAAINDNALSKFVGELYVAPIATPAVFTRVASVRGMVANTDNTVDQIEIIADDTGTILKGARPEVRFEGSFLENADRDIMEILLGGVSANVAGSLVAGASQLVASGAWGYNDPIVIENQNGNGSLLIINSVTGSVDGALVANTDYFVGQDAQGRTVVTVIDSATVTTETQTITINYDYTPNASENLTITASFREDPRMVVKIVATSGGNDRTVILSDATFEGAYGLEFLDVIEAGDLNGTPFVFKGAKGSTLEYKNEIL